MKDKYVLDSSIWIELERQNPKVLKKVVPLIKKNEICVIDLIIAEVLRGTKTRKDFESLSDVFENFNILSTSWIKVAELAFDVSKAGYAPPLTDLYIAQCVIDNKRSLITQDKDFIEICRVQPFELEVLRS